MFVLQKETSLSASAKLLLVGCFHTPINYCHVCSSSGLKQSTSCTCKEDAKFGALFGFFYVRDMQEAFAAQQQGGLWSQLSIIPMQMIA